VAKQRKEFVKEIRKFANIRHPNVVDLKGYYWGPTLCSTRSLFFQITFHWEVLQVFFMVISFTVLPSFMTGCIYSILKLNNIWSDLF